jgi:hypothetical protein
MEDHPAQRRFPAAGFTDNPERFSLFYRKRDVIDSMQ